MAALYVTRTQGANADCNPAEPISSIGRVSKAPTAGRSVRSSKPRRSGSTPDGSTSFFGLAQWQCSGLLSRPISVRVGGPELVRPIRLQVRSRGFHPRQAGSLPAWGANEHQANLVEAAR